MRIPRFGKVIGIAAYVLFWPQLVLATKHFQITSCPYKADVAGAVYTVMNEIGVRSGDCIDVTAPRITIEVNGQTVYTDSNSNTNAIAIFPAAKGARILGPGTVYQTIMDEGDSALIQGLTIGGIEGNAAVVLEGVDGSVVKGNVAYGGWGSIWLDNTRNCTVDQNKAINGPGYPFVGITVTNSNPAETQSRHNIISRNDVSDNQIGITIDGVGATCAQKVPSVDNIVSGNSSKKSVAPSFGIWLGCGARDTTVEHNTVLNEWNYDAFDANRDCKTSTWKHNNFKNVYPSCILGLPAKEKPLYNFQAGTDGDNPVTGLALDENGNLYGTVSHGGTLCGGLGCGYIFKMTRSAHGWTKTAIYEFNGTSGDGSIPSSDLIFDQSGNLYGETSGGGSADAGTVFKLTRHSDGSWAESTLYSFAGGLAGAGPQGGLIFDKSGNLFGVAGGGLDAGVVFELTPHIDGTWTEQLLYTFQPGGGDGIQPNGGIAFDAQGDLFGSTYSGGANGEGTIFELTPGQGGAWQEGIIYSFANDNNGRSPLGGVVFDGAGNLYGTTWRAGSSDAGTVFELSPGSGGGWDFELLHTFDGDQDVGNPVATMVMDSKGNLYGTAEGDGYVWPSIGSVFKLSNLGGKWKESVLFRFGGGPDGGYPVDSVVFDRAGNLYGTAYDGGTNDSCFSGCGVVFEVLK